jgi:hypothetical protein
MASTCDNNLCCWYLYWLCSIVMEDVEIYTNAASLYYVSQYSMYIDVWVLVCNL